MHIRYYQPYKGFSNHFTYLLYHASLESEAFDADFRDLWPLMESLSDKQDFAKDTLKKERSIPDALWSGFRDKLDWDELVSLWDSEWKKRYQGKKPDKKVSNKVGRYYPKIRKTTLINVIEEYFFRSLPFESKAVTVSVEVPNGDVLSRKAILTVADCDTLVWHPSTQLVVGFLEALSYSLCSTAVNHILQKVGSPLSTKMMLGKVSTKRILVCSEDKEFFTRHSRFCFAGLCDGSYSSRTYLTRENAEKVFSLALDAPSMVAASLQQS